MPKKNDLFLEKLTTFNFMENSELNQLIELLNNPSALKQKVVELKSNSDLEDEIIGFITLYDLFEGDSSKIKKYLEESKKQIISPIKLKSTSFSYLKYAAIFILILGISLFYFQKKEASKLALKNEFNEPGIANYMSTQTTSLWEEIMYDYKMHKFVSAYTKIERELKNSPTNDTLIYFSGIVNYELKKEKIATTKLTKIALSNSIFKDRASYYLGRIAFENGNSKKAKKIFKSLLKSNDLDIKNASFENLSELKSKE